ncbi:MAG: hypothetical protein INQ03_11190 [Candidatus Heimdallarchaeota archaeon]|nr:hypothetical protein [Candidatus Heimdallarchaeota archaeon]
MILSGKFLELPSPKLEVEFIERDRDSLAWISLFSSAYNLDPIEVGEFLDEILEANLPTVVIRDDDLIACASLSIQDEKGYLKAIHIRTGDQLKSILAFFSQEFKVVEFYVEFTHTDDKRELFEAVGFEKQ